VPKVVLLTELRFRVNTKYVILKTQFPANLLASTETSGSKEPRIRLGPDPSQEKKVLIIDQ